MSMPAPGGRTQSGAIHRQPFHRELSEQALLTREPDDDGDRHLHYDNDPIHSDATSLAFVEDSDSTGPVRAGAYEFTPPEPRNEKNRDALQRPCTWLPFALQLPYLGFCVVLCLVLGAGVLVMTIYSRTHNGLSDNNETPGQVFGWRFAPTLVAVLYSMVIGSLLRDIKRTEVFARLSANGGASAETTLLWPSRSWWNDPVDALRSGKHGRRSWALFFASIASIAAFLVISPLSAALLEPTVVQTSRTRPFLRYAPASALSISNSTEDIVMFQTISGYVLNTSTSAWITNEHFVLPSWPEGGLDNPLSAHLVVQDVPQTQSSQSTAIKVEFDCIPLEIKGMRNSTKKEVVDLDNGNYRSVDFQPFTQPDNSSNTMNMTQISISTSDGCSIEIYEDTDAIIGITFGAIWWIDSLARMNWTGLTTSNGYVHPQSSTKMTTSGTCGSRSMFLVSQGKQKNGDLRMHGDLCDIRFMEADVDVNVNITGIGTQIDFDEEQWSAKVRPLDTQKFNTAALEKSFFTLNWAYHTGGTDAAYAFGPMRTLSRIAKYNVDYGNAVDPDFTNVVDSTTLLEDARKLYQQFLGQSLLNQINAQVEPDSSDHAGTVSTYVSRIVVIDAVGIILTALLLLSALLILITIFLTRLKRRPLGLFADPASVAQATSLLVSSQDVTNEFRGLDLATKEQVAQSLHGHYCIQGGILHLMNYGAAHDSQLASLKPASGSDYAAVPLEEDKPQPPVKQHNSVKVILRRRLGAILIFTLTILVGALVALYVVSQGGGLIGRAFVNEFDFTVAGAATRLAPYSIIPTLFAIAVKLWCASIIESLMRLEPISTLLPHPRSLQQSILSEYVSTQPALAFLQAARLRHWTIFFMSVSAICLEIFTVSMSALWTKDTTIRTYPLSMPRQLEIRSVPGVFSNDFARHSAHVDDGALAAIRSTLGNYYLNWLTGATVEITTSSSTPPWTRDTWAFAPVDLQAVHANMSSIVPKASYTKSAAYNITVRTPGIRGRLECAALDYVADTANWLEEFDFAGPVKDAEITNATAWNTSNIPPGIDKGYEIGRYLIGPQYNVTIGPSARVLQCCTNYTNDQPDEAAIGYWSTSSSLYTKDDHAFVAKWIVGTPIEGIYSDLYVDSDVLPVFDDHWFWKEPPQMQAVNCSAHFETVDANVVVDMGTGTVYSYELLDAPKIAESAWYDPFVARIRNNAPIGDAYNVTVSWGYLFWSTLVQAANIGGAGDDGFEGMSAQPLTDHNFNIRVKGLNTDFMSYAMLALVNGSTRELLDADTMIVTANQTFGTFFKHFVAEQVNFTDGGNVFQPIGAKFPDYASQWNASANTEGGYNESMASPIALSAMSDAHYAVEMLVMSKAAVGLSLAMLGFLMLAFGFAYIFHVPRLKSLPRLVDDLACLLAYVYASPRLHDWVNTRVVNGKRRAGHESTNLLATLGDFRRPDGSSGWGIELGYDDLEQQHQPPNSAVHDGIEMNSLMSRTERQ